MDAPVVPDLRDLSATRKLLRGARYALAGVRLVLLRPSLWGYLVAPASITILLFFGVSFFAWQGIGLLLGLLWTPGAHSSALFAGLWWVFGLLVKVTAVATTALALYFTAGLIATPFNDRLSEQIETSVLGPYEEPFSWKVMAADLAVSVSHSLVSLTLWLTVMVSGLMLNLVPGIGSVASFLVGGLCTSLFLSREAMDGCLSRRRMSFGHKFRIVVQHFPLFLGFGIVASCMLWVPFLNFLLLPMAVAGGTLMYCHLEQQGLIPDAQGNLGFISERARVAALADHGAERDGLGHVHPPHREREPLHAG
ncbi:MAG: EI24 domain-containing protein [Myxococcota bacterium]